MFTTPPESPRETICRQDNSFFFPSMHPSIHRCVTLGYCFFVCRRLVIVAIWESLQMKEPQLFLLPLASCSFDTYLYVECVVFVYRLVLTTSLIDERLQAVFICLLLTAVDAGSFLFAFFTSRFAAICLLLLFSACCVHNSCCCCGCG